MAQGQITRGTNLRFKFDGKTVFHATSCSLSSSTATDETGTKDTKGTIATPGDISRTLSTDALIYHVGAGDEDTQTDWIGILQKQDAAEEFAFEFSTGASGDRIVSGSCFVSSVDITADNGSNATGSFSFMVSGDIVIDTIA